MERLLAEQHGTRAPRTAMLQSYDYEDDGIDDGTHIPDLRLPGDDDEDDDNPEDSQPRKRAKTEPDLASQEELALRLLGAQA